MLELLFFGEKNENDRSVVTDNIVAVTCEKNSFLLVNNQLQFNRMNYSRLWTERESGGISFWIKTMLNNLRRVFLFDENSLNSSSSDNSSTYSTRIKKTTDPSTTIDDYSFKSSDTSAPSNYVTRVMVFMRITPV